MTWNSKNREITEKHDKFPAIPVRSYLLPKIYKKKSKKIQSIVQNVGHSDTVLDIGCNQGYVVRSFFEQGLINFGFGIDLDVSVVDPWLIAETRFSFFQGNILDYPFTQSYETIIFNSVLHHVFGTYGKITAFRLWDNIVDHCDRILIFETGVLSELGKYYWKDKFLKYYSTDEEILNTLLGRIGARLKNITPIVSLPIHLTTRPIYKIELFPIDSPYNLKVHEEEFYGNDYHPDTKWNVAHSYFRTIGSKNQQLTEIT